MSTKSEITGRVLQYFRAKWRNVDLSTDMRKQLLLNDKQVVDIGFDLAQELGCNPTTTAIKKCKTIGDLAKLLGDTRHRANLRNVI